MLCADLGFLETVRFYFLSGGISPPWHADTTLRGSPSDQPQLEVRRPACRGRGLQLWGLAVLPDDTQPSLANHVSHLTNGSSGPQMSGHHAEQ